MEVRVCESERERERARHSLRLRRLSHLLACRELVSFMQQVCIIHAAQHLAADLRARAARLDARVSRNLHGRMAGADVAKPVCSQSVCPPTRRTSRLTGAPKVIHPASCAAIILGSAASKPQSRGSSPLPPDWGPQTAWARARASLSLTPLADSQASPVKRDDDGARAGGGGGCS